VRPDRPGPRLDGAVVHALGAHRSEAGACSLSRRAASQRGGRRLPVSGRGGANIPMRSSTIIFPLPAADAMHWPTRCASPRTRGCGSAGTDSIAVNSMHHQGIARLAPGLVPVATSPDGLIEGVERCVGARAFPGRRAVAPRRSRRRRSAHAPVVRRLHRSRRGKLVSAIPRPPHTVPTACLRARARAPGGR